MATAAPKPRLLIYVLRRDVRLSDNPLFYHASLYSSDSGATAITTPALEARDQKDSQFFINDTTSFTHLLPVYIFPADQIEVSGFLRSSTDSSPYPEARSRVAGVWRTGPHRAKFLAEGVWDLKQRLQGLGCGSGLEVRVGMVGEVIEHMLEWFAGQEGQKGQNGPEVNVAGVWMTAGESPEEKDDEKAVQDIAHKRAIHFKTWQDEKYYIDDRDLPFEETSDLPNVYTSFRKSVEPLRKRPRPALPSPRRLPPLPPQIPPQKEPFEIPTTFEKFKDSVLSPLQADATFGLTFPPHWPEGTESAHPFEGGETEALVRLSHLITSGAMTSYKATRNGMLGRDFSTKLSAYLAQGHITARQIHWAMVDFEEGNGEGKDTDGYGKGENDGTAGVRFELLWRDYMRLCLRKFGSRMYSIDGIREDWDNTTENDLGDANDTKKSRPPRKRWRQIDKPGVEGAHPSETREMFERFRSGRTGIGLIDASNRELFLTGYTSNRARQNVASFLSSHLGIDWRIGAEWYEFLLVDHDSGNNWGNWQYVSGVGNDPRQGRVFNPVKQAFDYDAQGKYIKAWVPELRGVRLNKEGNAKKEEIDPQKLLGLYQAWMLSRWEREFLGLKGLEWVENPLKKIQFSISRGKGSEGEPRGRGKGGRWGRGRGRGMRRLGAEEKAQRNESPEV